MRKTLSILCAACVLPLTFSCKKEVPASLEVAPTELSWEWNDTEPQTVTVTANYDWTAEVSDAANWTLTPANDGKNFTVAPKSQNKTEDALTVTVTVTCKDLVKTITCTQAGVPFADGHEYVDLGLSVKWATCNVGAESEADYGQYFAWGETVEKTKYDWSNSGEYKWGIYDSNDMTNWGMTKYNTKDSIITLEAADDPATTNWGSKWHTPTLDEITDLLDKTKCEWIWDPRKDANGTDVEGYTVTSKINGNSIFLPAASYRIGTELEDAGYNGYYWSSSLYDPTFACYLHFEMGNLDWSYRGRNCGLSVRAVTK